MPTVPGDQTAGRQPGAEPYMRARVGADDLRPGSSPLPTPCRPFAVRAFAAAAIGLAAGLVGGGCTPSVQMQAVMPAKNEDAARLRRVAVLNFEGRAGQEVADRLEEVHVGLRLNVEP